jgi:hypothetical protein
VTDSTRRTIRTAVQAAVSLAAAAPLLGTASGIAETSTGVAAFLAVSAAVTRLMAVPAVDSLLPVWLRKEKF